MRTLHWSFVLSLILGSAALAAGGDIDQAPTALTTTHLTQVSDRAAEAVLSDFGRLA